MQTNLADFIKDTEQGKQAEEILRACVHCGFCTATCPTYQLLGDELDGPRGRIYLIKQVLEGQPVSRSTQQHLDRCLSCRSCETTCPSGVEYGRLLDIGRQVVETRVKRPLLQGIARSILKESLPRAWIFTPAVKLGQALRPLLPNTLRKKLPAKQAAGLLPQTSHSRKMLLHDGCVQPALLPNINAATRRVLDQLGVQVVLAEKAACCGAIRFHLQDQAAALDDMRRNIDAWWPLLETEQVEAIISTASGCGVMLKDYGHLLAHDAAYASKAARVAALSRDISEVLAQFSQPLQMKLSAKKQPQKLAYHPPCTLQHGQRLAGQVETLLAEIGMTVQRCQDSHLCCGSAGTYSLLQTDIAQQLRNNKLRHLQHLQPDTIITANLGCQMHLQSGTHIPVKHWIEVLDQALQSE